jgi:hypothetical protein
MVNYLLATGAMLTVFILDRLLTGKWWWRR